VPLPLRDPIDLRDLVRAQRPIDRLDVLLDLLDAGGAVRSCLRPELPAYIASRELLEISAVDISHTCLNVRN
jgi:hypothetical protein